MFPCGLPIHPAFASSACGAPCINRNHLLQRSPVVRTRPVPVSCRMQDNTMSTASSTPRIACLCEYNGASFSGWERKPATRTVQGTIEHALSKISGIPLPIAGASKTDARTHAVGQVFHFDPPVAFVNSRAWVAALNKRLPADILIIEAGNVSKSFHARKNATWRRYRYSILTSPQKSVFLSPLVWHFYQKTLNIGRMHEAAQMLVCSQAKDFSAFRKARSSATHSHITVYDVSVQRASYDSNLVEIEVCANWFVYGMMRLLTAALVEVGTGALSVEEFANIFRLQQRHRVRYSAPASGLCLVEVGYPTHEQPFANSGFQQGSSPKRLWQSPYIARPLMP